MSNSQTLGMTDPGEINSVNPATAQVTQTPAYRGAWSAGVQYYSGDIVVYANQFWLCVLQEELSTFAPAPGGAQAAGSPPVAVVPGVTPTPIYWLPLGTVGSRAVVSTPGAPAPTVMAHPGSGATSVVLGPNSTDNAGTVFFNTGPQANAQQVDVTLARVFNPGALVLVSSGTFNVNFQVTQSSAAGFSVGSNAAAGTAVAFAYLILEQ